MTEYISTCKHGVHFNCYCLRCGEEKQFTLAKPRYTVEKISEIYKISKQVKTPDDDFLDEDYTEVSIYAKKEGKKITVYSNAELKNTAFHFQNSTPERVQDIAELLIEASKI